MKLLIITAIRGFKKEIKTILKKADVKNYSYKDVIGYRDASELLVNENWFSNDMNEGEAVFFYAFVNKENVDLVFDLVKEFNQKQETISTIHLAEINIERTN
jgi:nitrogen regulatory protein PII